MQTRYFVGFCVSKSLLVAQAGCELTTQQRMMALDSCSSCLYLPIAEVIGILTTLTCKPSIGVLMPFSLNDSHVLK